MAKQILRNTETFAAVKIWGATSVETVDLDVDLIIANRLVLDGDTQTVNIMSVTWAGAADSLIEITRNGVDVITLDGEAANTFSFDNLGFNDNVENTSDIVVTITGDGYLYMALRKAGGYKQTFEPEIFGSYDDPTLSGS